MHRSEFAFGGRDGGIDAAAIGDVAGHRQRPPAAGVDAGCDGLRGLDIAVEHGDPRTELGEAPAAGAADAAASAGDDDSLVLKSAHGILLMRWDGRPRDGPLKQVAMR